MTKLKHYIIFGPPGAGKGTFCSRILSINPNIIHVSTGDIFRENIKNETKLGIKVKNIIDKGDLVPDDLTNLLIKEKLEELIDKSWILDGYPRTINQTLYLEKITRIDKVLILTIEESVIIQRILGRYACKECGFTYNKFFEATQPKKEGICDNCGADLKFEQRADDNEETIKNRLKTYEDNAKPIIDFYKKKGIIVKVDSTKTLDYTREEIMNFLN